MIKAVAFAFSLVFAPFAIQALAQNQNTSGSTTQPSSQPAQGNTTGGASQTTRETRTATTTTQTSQPTETTTGLNPVWIAVAAIAVIGLIAFLVMAGRRRSGSADKTVYESKTVVKKD